MFLSFRFLLLFFNVFFFEFMFFIPFKFLIGVFWGKEGLIPGISFNGLQDQATKLKDAEVLLEQNQREMERLLEQLRLADR